MSRKHSLPLLALLTASLAVPAAASPWHKTDLSELADGERREIDAGDRTIVAQRVGDVVNITIEEGDGDHKTMECRVGQDRCLVLTQDGDEAKKVKMMLMRHDGDGEVTADHEAFVMHHGHGHAEHDATTADGNRMIVVRRHAGEDGEEVIEKEIRIVSGAGGDEVVWHGEPEGGEAMLFAGDGAELHFGGHGAGEGEHMVIELATPAKTVLRCPEGDTHMTVAEDEADVAYSCPKHGVQLEKVERRLRRKVIREHHAEEK